MFLLLAREAISSADSILSWDVEMMDLTCRIDIK